MMTNPDKFIQKCFHKVVFIVLTAVHLGTAAQAQMPKRVREHVDFGLEVANNHLWRGIEVSDGIVMCADLAIHDKADHFKLGFWSGTNSTGNYKEFNFFAEAKSGGWKLSLWDTYNFSPGANYNNREFFNYSARSTGRFLDGILSYSFAQSASRFPLTLSWSTILFGRDRWSDNRSNRYSSYVSAEYLLFQDASWRFDVCAGGCFTLASQTGDRSTFYSDKAGLIHLQLRVEHQVRLTRTYTLPLFACAVFNPVMDRAFFQMGAQVFRF